MSKSFKKARNLVIIFLLAFTLSLPTSVATQAQVISSFLPTIPTRTQVIEGKLLTIPQFSNSFLNTTANYQKSFESKLRQVPELKKVKFLRLDINNLSQTIIPDFIASADNYWSKAELSDTNIPINQYVSGIVTCTGQNVPVAPPAGLVTSYLELSDYMGSSGSNYGKRWISGDQLVEGGCGILKSINGGKEPAGRLVWGTDAFKIVLDSADERTMKAEFSAYMRICANLPTGRTCTPYFIRLPWFPVQGNNWVAIGGGMP